MPRYSVSGLVLDADLELPELARAAADAPPQWTFRADTAPPPPVDRTFASFAGDWGLLGASGDVYVLQYRNLVDVVADPATRTARYTPRAGLEPHTLRHLLIDQVLPHLIALGGGLVLHASAVGVDGRAVVFVGRSGAGKSSLAAAVVHQGADLLGDDAIPLEPHGEGYLAHPSYSGLRLWEDSAAAVHGDAAALPTVAEYTPKRRLDLQASLATGPLPLQALVAVDPDHEPEDGLVELTPHRGAAGYVELYQHAFRFERTGPAAMAADLDRFSELIVAVPLLRVRYRRDLRLLDEVAATLLDRLRTAGTSASTQ